MNGPSHEKISNDDFFKLAAATSKTYTVDTNRIAALAASVKNKQEIPVVVIGGGLGGLGAAAIFSRYGFPVTLVEKHDRPGGYATAFQRKKGRFNFEVSLHATSGTKAGPLRRIFEETDILGKLEMIDLPEQSRVIAPDYDLTFPHGDPQATIDLLCDAFPAQRDGIQGFFDDIFGLLDEAMIPFNADSKAERDRFPKTHNHMWAVRHMTLANLLDKHVKDPRARSLLAHYWVYAGLPPSKLSAFRYGLLCAGLTRFGGQVVRGRSQDLSNALVDTIEKAGGRVLLNTRAVSIHMENGAVTGVVLDDGRTIASKVLISNASPEATIRMLPEKDLVNGGPGGLGFYAEQINAYTPSISSFGVWLGLNQEIRGKVKGYEFFILKTYDSEADYQACLDTDLAQAGIGVAIYDNLYEGYSTPGTSSVVITMLNGYDHWRPFEKDYKAGQKEAYQKEKNRIADELIQQAEKYVIPELRSMIEVKVSSTPLTNWRYTLNKEGAIYGYQQPMDKTYMRRLDNRTPLKGLYLAGAYSEPSSGYFGVLRSGELAFHKMIEDWADISGA